MSQFLLGFVPPLVPEGNLCGAVAKVLHGPDVLLDTQPCESTESYWEHLGKSSTGIFLSLCTYGLLREGALVHLYQLSDASNLASWQHTTLCLKKRSTFVLL